MKVHETETGIKQIQDCTLIGLYGSPLVERFVISKWFESLSRLTRDQYMCAVYSDKNYTKIPCNENYF